MKKEFLSRNSKFSSTISSRARGEFIHHFFGDQNPQGKDQVEARNFERRGEFGNANWSGQS